MTLIGIQLLGLVISVLLVAVTFSNPDQVEERLRQFAIEEVERAAQEVWSNRTVGQSEGSMSEKLMALSDRLGTDAQVLDAQRKEVVPAILALAKSETCNENCEFWVLASQLTNLAMVERVAQIRVGQSTFGDLLVERYETSVQGLLTDLRRFGLVNVVVLSLMLGLVVFRNHLNWRFTAFSVALTGYTAWAAYGYIYNQNWALAILFQDWASPGYQAAMIFFALLFFDWLFLRGNVTQAISNFIASALSG
ncbi:hypothetical protein A8B82_15320 [Sulfitobacter sp. EhC04]|uniref:hypothetical protein n=1 Tax=Sulfitobacter sp. EhC04 TaxID=1849168 RepID=UPI0007F55835|nr:hypothetical protein [Sulfitobacter sp. EhC04]OAN76143.1 hypothetical protein A8B82_15320 [Sulfitobacter sp. EhC04]